MNDENALTDHIRGRAFELFLVSNSADGHAQEHWLEAEHELMLVPKAYRSEKNGLFDPQIAVPRFDAKHLRVLVLSKALIVRAQAMHKHSDKDCDVHFRQPGEETIFRRFDLPAPINADKVHASLENGMLTVTAPRAEIAHQLLAAGAAA